MPGTDIGAGNRAVLLLCSSVPPSCHPQSGLVCRLTQLHSDFFDLHMVSKLVFIFLSLTSSSPYCTVDGLTSLSSSFALWKDLSTIDLDTWALEKLVLFSLCWCSKKFWVDTMGDFGMTVIEGH